MRLLREIINDCKDGKVPSIDEARFAICVLDSLATFDMMGFSSLYKGKLNNKKQILVYDSEWQFTESRNRWQRALEKSPKEWLGDNNNPDSLDVQNRRELSKNIYKKITD